MNLINWRVSQLWKGCILASIAHAIMVRKFPECANEHSWDGHNYSVQDSAGQRGTITFYNDSCVGVFRNDKSKRLCKYIPYVEYLQGADDDIVKLAKQEALQYVLDDYQDTTVPIITTAFWGRDELYSNDCLEEMLINGGNLLEIQMLEIECAIDRWKEYYEMDKDEVHLMKSLYKRKINNSNAELLLTNYEIAIMEKGQDIILEESIESFKELLIQWQ